MRRALAGLAALASLLACAAELPIWEQPPPPIADQPVIRPGALHRYPLGNGPLAIVLEDHRLPRVSVGVSLRRGAASVEPERAGLAGFTAELMKRGAGERDSLALASAVDALGAVLSVSADWDSITAQVWGLERDLDQLLAILADVVLRPRFEAAEALRARGELLALLERARDDPHTLERRFAYAALYPGLRVGLPLAGSPESVATLDAAAARDFHARMFVANNAILFAVGDVDAAALRANFEAAFGAWRTGEIPAPGPRYPTPAPPARRIVVVDRPDLAQTRISLAHEGIARDDADRIPANILSSAIAGNTFSSRLMQRLRADTGLTYGVGSAFSMQRGGGTFTVSTFTQTADARRVIDLLLAELERARREPPAGEELAATRALAVGDFALGIETSDAVLASLVDLEIHGLPEDALDTFRSRVRAVTEADMQRIATRLLHPERCAIVLVGPARELEPQLADLGSIEWVKP
ncbi:MAG TPA: pitrilysin family protein [Myxococcota bacterium]|nr:pitrilysin family protein [Myxococcota bacterium]